MNCHCFILLILNHIFSRDINMRPFKVPMKQQTTMQYVSAISCLLSFVLRVKLGKVRLGGGASNLEMSRPVSEVSQHLLDSLSSPINQTTTLSDAIHNLLMSLCRSLEQSPLILQCRPAPSSLCLEMSLNQDRSRIRMTLGGHRLS